jgi:hypothetical protein
MLSGRRRIGLKEVVDVEVMRLARLEAVMLRGCEQASRHISTNGSHTARTSFLVETLTGHVVTLRENGEG